MSALVVQAEIKLYADGFKLDLARLEQGILDCVGFGLENLSCSRLGLCSLEYVPLGYCGT
jgi:hypothetical protein